jgi:ABC-2 type transport system ATP-binding protein
MLQRVGLAQSLINDPEIVFMDEPMSGLDPIGRREVRELIAELRTKGTTVFMSTHILSDVEALCDEVTILRKGKLAASGNLYDLLQKNEEHRSFEVTVSGVSVESLKAELASRNDVEIFANATGVTITVPDENDVERVIHASRKMNGKLISVIPVKQSLEELFVSNTNP